jgi:single-stranded DNA-specific DHH superfamily exonuclease
MAETARTVYGVEALTALYNQALTQDLDQREKSLKLILSESVITAKIYEQEFNTRAAEYGIVVKRSNIETTVTSLASTIGISTGNPIGFAVAGLSELYKAIIGSTRRKELQNALTEVQAIQAKAQSLAVLYENSTTQLSRISWLRLAQNPVLWIILVLVVVILIFIFK